MKRFLDLITTEEAPRDTSAEFSCRADRDGRQPQGARPGRGERKSIAREDIPHFFRSNMDGFAVRAADTFGASTTVVGAARRRRDRRHGREPRDVARARRRPCAKISTGAMMPPGADAVVIVEHTEERRRQHRRARSRGCRANTIAIAEDMRAGDVVFEPGHRLRGSDVGVLTGVGHAGVDVTAVPRVGVVATGDEIVEPEDELPPGRVRNVNEYLLASLATPLGADVNDYGVIGDDADAARPCCSRAGSPRTTCAACRAEAPRVRRISYSATFERDARRGDSLSRHRDRAGQADDVGQERRQALLGVPGNPAAAAVVFTLFGAPLVRVLGGERLERILTLRPRVRARLARTRIAAAEGREDYMRVRLESDDGDPAAWRSRSAASRWRSRRSRAPTACCAFRLERGSRGRHRGRRAAARLSDETRWQSRGIRAARLEQRAAKARALSSRAYGAERRWRVIAPSTSPSKRRSDASSPSRCSPGSRHRTTAHRPWTASRCDSADTRGPRRWHRS